LRELRIEEANRAAAARYMPRAYHGKLTYFQGYDDQFRDPKPFWTKLVGAEVEVHLAPGSGVRIFQEPRVTTLARRLKALLG
jgi:hypothetical protein